MPRVIGQWPTKTIRLRDNNFAISNYSFVWLLYPPYILHVRSAMVRFICPGQFSKSPRNVSFSRTAGIPAKQNTDVHASITDSSNFLKIRTLNVFRSRVYTELILYCRKIMSNQITLSLLFFFRPNSKFKIEHRIRTYLMSSITSSSRSRNLRCLDIVYIR